MIAMSVIVGIIFMGLLKRFRQTSIEEYYQKRIVALWNDFKFAIIATVPAILLHEFGHKFVAMAFGLTAVFKAAWVWLGIGLILKFTGFVFFVPAYVAISGPVTTPPYIFSFVAFAGPAVNLVLWLLARAALKRGWFSEKYRPIVYLTKQINMFLFIFNMLPIPGFDGLKVYQGLFQTIF